MRPGRYSIIRIGGLPVNSATASETPPKNPPLSDCMCAGTTSNRLASHSGSPPAAANRRVLSSNIAHSIVTSDRCQRLNRVCTSRWPSQCLTDTHVEIVRALAHDCNPRGCITLAFAAGMVFVSLGNRTALPTRIG